MKHMYTEKGMEKDRDRKWKVTNHEDEFSNKNHDNKHTYVLVDFIIAL